MAMSGACVLIGIKQVETKKSGLVTKWGVVSTVFWSQEFCFQVIFGWGRGGFGFEVGRLRRKRMCAGVAGGRGGGGTWVICVGFV